MKLLENLAQGTQKTVHHRPLVQRAAFGEIMAPWTKFKLLSMAWGLLTWSCLFSLHSPMWPVLQLYWPRATGQYPEYTLIFCTSVPYSYRSIWKARPNPVQLGNFHSPSRFTADISSTVKHVLGDSSSWFSCISAHLERERQAVLCAGLSLQGCLYSK